MAYGFNLHTVHNGIEKGAPIVLAAGRVHKYDGDELDEDLVKLGAVREPTDEELALYILANPNDEDVPKSAKTKAKKLKAEGGLPADGADNSGEALV